VKRKPRKSFPTSVKTLGEHIRLKRREKGLTQAKTAQLARIPVALFNEWERDMAVPSPKNWTSLVALLDLDSAFRPAIPTAE
jgi:DNA-binding transcriptional regulator YiaG